MNAIEYEPITQRAILQTMAWLILAVLFDPRELMLWAFGLEKGPYML